RAFQKQQERLQREKEEEEKRIEEAKPIVLSKEKIGEEIVMDLGEMEEDWGESSDEEEKADEKNEAAAIAVVNNDSTQMLDDDVIMLDPSGAGKSKDGSQPLDDASLSLRLATQEEG